jgi:hypothetical protein
MHEGVLVAGAQQSLLLVSEFYKYLAEFQILNALTLRNRVGKCCWGKVGPCAAVAVLAVCCGIGCAASVQLCYHIP